MTRVFVPRDAAALALGAEGVARALAAQGAGRGGSPPSGEKLTIVRTGSRGLFWLEPMVEVETPEGRIAYGPVTPRDIPGLLAAGMLHGGAHPLRLGRPEDLPFLARQTRFTFARCGIVDPLSLDDYRAAGGLKGLRRALDISPARIVERSRNPACAAVAARAFPPASSGRPPPTRPARGNTSSATPTRAIPAPTPIAC